jgi:hypothetical protein
MAFLTIFSAPKPFTDVHIATIQRNAIKSWALLPEVQVLLLGDEPGVEKEAGELGVRHLPGVKCSGSGTPLISSMLQLARENSSSPLLCIINTDILLLPDFIQAARRVASQSKKFVLLGQRWDLDLSQPVEFTEGWQDRLRSIVQDQGQLHRPAGSDFFLFPRTCYTQVPDFVIGRAGWDNWMIYQARKSGFPAIDATHDVLVVHQNHDYSHLPGGRPHYDHPETDENIRLAGGRPMTRFTLLDTDKRLVDGKLLPQVLDRARLWRRIEAWPLLALGSSRLSNALWRLRNIFR